MRVAVRIPCAVSSDTAGPDGRFGNTITLADRARGRGCTASRESWRSGGAGRKSDRPPHPRRGWFAPHPFPLPEPVVAAVPEAPASGTWGEAACRGVGGRRGPEPRFPSSSVRCAAGVRASSLLTPGHGPHRLTGVLPAPRRLWRRFVPTGPRAMRMRVAFRIACAVSSDGIGPGGAGSATPSRYTKAGAHHCCGVAHGV